MDIWKVISRSDRRRAPMRKPKWQPCLAGILLTLLVILRLACLVEAGRTVRVGVYQNKPKVFMDEQGRASGLFIDLLEEIAALEGWSLVYVPCEWSDCLAALEAGQIDLMPDVAYSVERDILYDFHHTPVVESWSQVYARPRTTIYRLPDLAGQRVAVLRGSIQQTTFEQMMRGFGFDVEIVPTTSLEEAFELAAKGEVDAAIANTFFGDYFYKQYGLLKTAVVFSAVTLHYATAEGHNADLLEAIDRHLETWMATPGSFYYKTLSRWTERPVASPLPSYLRWGVVITGVLLLVAVGVIWFLRHEVRLRAWRLVQADATLRESEERFRLAFHTSPDAININRMADGLYVNVNEGFTTLTGYTSEDVIGKSSLDIQIWYDPADRQKLLEGLRTRGYYENLEARFRCKNGDVRIGLMSARVIMLHGVPHILSITRDITERKQAEEALRESEARYRSLFNNNHAVMLLIDPDGGAIVDANPAAEKYYGWTCEELRQKKISDINTLSPEEVQAEMNLARNQQRHQFYFRHRRADGTIRDVEMFSGPISMKGRALLYSIVHDITERKQAEALLRENEQRHRRYAGLLSELIGGGQFFQGTLDENLRLIARLSAHVMGTERTSIWVYTQEYTEIECRCLYTLSTNEYSAGEKLRAAEFPTYTASHKIGSVVAAYDVRTDPRTCEIPAAYYDAYDIHSLLDAPIWMRGRLTALLSFEHVGEKRRWLPEEEQLALTLATYISFCLEADERVRTEEALQKSEERLRVALTATEQLLAQIQAQARQVQDIIDTVPEGVLLLSARGWVLLANPVAESLLESLGVDVNTQLTQLGNRPLSELLTSPPQGLRHEVTVGDRFLEIIARPVANGPEPEQWVLVIHEATQERAVRQQLERQERLASLGQLAAGIAHDFNNILAGIVLYSQISLRMPSLSPQLRERLTVIVEQAHRAADLIDQILDFGRRAVLDRQPVDLAALLTEQVKLWERTLPETIRITLTYGSEAYFVKADQTRMQQVFMNLVLNARDAMPEGGELRINLTRLYLADMEPPGEWIRVDVSDTGMGIPEEILPHIYDPFFTTKEPGKGSGMGLAQVYGIVMSHDGRIDVKTQVGAGTTFSIYLPALQIEPVAPASVSETLSFGHGETILVVEDNPTTRSAIVAALEMLQYRPLEATNGKEALDIVAQHPGEIALVLSDLVMPEMSGKALAAALRQRALPVPLVVMSGHPLEREVDSLRASGVVGWVQKPPDLQELSEVLAQALAAPLAP
ncbi:MAG TPA: PAS domain S-box protein [Anaerolineae bacterium]|nr:PAS domain S-box protein [Anaerolineae bacterium]HQK14272.1 PAS domain S-box protein [Anaerolineae bacterium]